MERDSCVPGAKTKRTEIAACAVFEIEWGGIHSVPGQKRTSRLVGTVPDMTVNK